MQARRLFLATAVLAALVFASLNAAAQNRSTGVPRAGDLASKQESSRSAHRAAGPGPLDTVAKPVKNFLLFGYELIRGTASTARCRATTCTRRRPCRCFPADADVHSRTIQRLSIRGYSSRNTWPRPAVPIIRADESRR